MKNKKQNRAIISVLGKDTVGIIAKVCTYLAGCHVNVLDISQTIVDEYFTMMMIVDLESSMKDFDLVQKELSQIGEEIGVEVKCQREEIFEMMHRI